MSGEVEKFLDGLDDSRLDSRLNLILNEVDSEINASGYEKYLDRRDDDLAFELGIPKEYLKDFTCEIVDEFKFRLVNKERSRKANKWNSKLECIDKLDYIFPEKDGFNDEYKE